MEQLTQRQLNELKEWKRWRRLQQEFAANPFRLIVQQAATKRPWALINSEGKICVMNQQELTVYSDKMMQVHLNEQQYEEVISFYKQGKDVLFQDGVVKEWVVE